MSSPGATPALCQHRALRPKSTLTFAGMNVTLAAKNNLDLLWLCRGFMVRATWLQPQTRYSDTESRAYISLQASQMLFLHLPTYDTRCVSTAEERRRVAHLLHSRHNNTLQVPAV